MLVPDVFCSIQVPLLSAPFVSAAYSEDPVLFTHLQRIRFIPALAQKASPSLHPFPRRIPAVRGLNHAILLWSTADENGSWAETSCPPSLKQLSSVIESPVLSSVAQKTVELGWLSLCGACKSGIGGREKVSQEYVIKGRVHPFPGSMIFPGTCFSSIRSTFFLHWLFQLIRGLIEQSSHQICGLFVVLESFLKAKTEDCISKQKKRFLKSV